MRKLFGLIFAASLMFACSTTATIGNLSKLGKKQSTLSNTKWELLDAAQTETKPFISFDPEQGLTGNAGCNNIFSQNIQIQSTNGEFSVKNLGSTLKACPNMDGAVERNFMDVLQSADHYVVIDKTQTLELYKGNILLVRFKAVP